MDKDVVKGTVKETIGQIEREAAAVRGDTAGEIKGAMRQLGGASERAAAQANTVVHDALDRPSWAPLLAAFAGGLILGLFLNRH